MTRGENFLKKGKCKNNRCLTTSNSPWSDLNKDCSFSKLRDKFRNPKCNCDKIFTFTPKSNYARK